MVRKGNISWMVMMVFLGFLLAAATAGAQEKVLLMATTTSTEDTGLLNVIGPEFKKASGIDLRWTATGTGKALKLGEDCNVDVLMVHAPGAEKKFVEAGFGLNRREIMYNDFIIIGPAADPAGVKGKSVKEALQAIRAKQALFVSRGDKSGTHMMELDLWKAVQGAVPEKESWYAQAGQGMIATINIAAEKNGYTLTDRGTYIKYESSMKGNPPLKILVEGDQVLFNQYSVIAVNPAKCGKAQLDLATKFSDWIAGPQGQKLIREFKLEGKPLFTANAK
ncbi:MAG: tungsten ABC transporter substrate-binding protein [Desulfobacteraceae bacterium]|nr:MAG: tungsten ABC transporter substrate-binding protein [Desulfobacteraceae bacterium]